MENITYKELLQSINANQDIKVTIDGIDYMLQVDTLPNTQNTLYIDNKQLKKCIDYTGKADLLYKIQSAINELKYHNKNLTKKQDFAVSDIYDFVTSLF